MKMNGISSREIKVISYLELEGKKFFTRNDIRKFFKNINEMNVYIHIMKKKGRIIRINKEKYYLIPVKAFEGHWSEHPFVVIDEIFDGSEYFIGGKAAAHYWGFIEQLPNEIYVYSTKKQGSMKIFGFIIRFRRTNSKNMKDFVTCKIKDHQFIIADKRRSAKWK